jgi:hypothetical protein
MPYPTGHREQVRSRIVESARRLFNRNGFEGRRQWQQARCPSRSEPKSAARSIPRNHSPLCLRAHQRRAPPSNSTWSSTLSSNAAPAPRIRGRLIF